MPRKRSKAFWNNFKFKYKLTIINENTLEEIVGLRVSKLNGLSVLLSVLAVLFLVLLVPYIRHYYFLENSVQKMYLIYNEIERLAGGPHEQ